jgi:outer membrane protein assembly factor BamB
MRQARPKASPEIDTARLSTRVGLLGKGFWVSVVRHTFARDLMKWIYRVAAGAVAYAVLFAALAAQTRPGDWPQWRGPARDGVVAAFSPPTAWPERLTRKWKVDVGLGYATPILVGDRLYMFSRQGDNEVLAALDTGSGKEIWAFKYAAPFAVNPAAARHEKGPKSTPSFADGRLFILGMTGIVTAVDAATGRQLWQKPASQPQPLYHTGMSPLVDRGLMIVHIGGHNQGALTAYDAKSGAVKWHWDGDGPGYGSPIAVDVYGTRQIVTFTQENVVGISAATGELLWKRPFTTPFTQNAITPILYNQTVIVSGLEQGVSAFRILKRGAGWATENVWENPQVSLYMANGVIVNDTLVSLSHKSSGQFFALDAKTGKTIWTSAPRQAQNAAIARAGDLLFILKDDGELVVARSGTKGLETIRAYTVADSATWAAPAISGDRFFVKDVASLALWALK